MGAGHAAQGAPAHAGADARGDPARDLRQPRPRAARRAARGARPDRLDAAPDRDVAASSGTSARTAASSTRGQAHRRARLRRASTRAGDGDSILDLLKASGATREELRDQLVTLLAAGHETTATALAWALERLARHPDRPRRRRPHRRRRQGGPAHPPRALDHRPQDAPAVQLGGYTLPEGVYVAPCLYLAHRRAGTDFDPSASSTAPEPFTFVPFGGGTRRCLGAAFAALEMREVLTSGRRSGSRSDPTRAEGERMRRRSVTLAPARGAEIIPRPASVSRRDARHVLSP